MLGWHIRYELSNLVSRSRPGGRPTPSDPIRRKRIRRYQPPTNSTLFWREPRIHERGLDCRRKRVRRSRNCSIVSNIDGVPPPNRTHGRASKHHSGLYRYVKMSLAWEFQIKIISYRTVPLPFPIRRGCLEPQSRVETEPADQGHMPTFRGGCSQPPSTLLHCRCPSRALIGPRSTVHRHKAVLGAIHGDEKGLRRDKVRSKRQPSHIDWRVRGDEPR